MLNVRDKRLGRYFNPRSRYVLQCSLSGRIMYTALEYREDGTIRAYLNKSMSRFDVIDDMSMETLAPKFLCLVNNNKNKIWINPEYPPILLMDVWEYA